MNKNNIYIYILLGVLLYILFTRILYKKLYNEGFDNSYSQLGQDLAVLEYYNNKEGGYFVEVGAADGIELSNTYLLEKKYNWKGICAEPIPEQYKKLVTNRPNSKCSNDAVYYESGMTLQFDIANNNGTNHSSNLLSGISSHIDTHKATVDTNKSTINVNTISLTDLLKQYDAPDFIEYLSLDTEGSEYEILKNFDFDKYKFGLIDVEHNYKEPRRSQIRELLISKGYEYLRENQFDDCYKYKRI